jgi:LuxR family maltose regulon positive regulatory protein
MDFTAQQALVYARQGELSRAARLLEGQRWDDSGANVSQPARLGTSVDMVWTEILLAQGKYKAAQQVLDNLLRHLPPGFPPQAGSRFQILRAAALFGQNKIYQANKVMVGLIRQAAPEGFMRPFIDYSLQMAPLLALALEKGNLTLETEVFVEHILQVTDPSSRAAHPLSPDKLRQFSIAASVTLREQEVLHLVGEGYSNRQIAHRLHISESTVKTHLRNIYDKLDANNRVQAIKRASELNLI